MKKFFTLICLFVMAASTALAQKVYSEFVEETGTQFSSVFGAYFFGLKRMMPPPLVCMMRVRRWGSQSSNSWGTCCWK